MLFLRLITIFLATLLALAAISQASEDARAWLFAVPAIGGGVAAFTILWKNVTKKSARRIATACIAFVATTSLMTASISCLVRNYDMMWVALDVFFAACVLTVRAILICDKVRLCPWWRYYKAI